MNPETSLAAEAVRVDRRGDPVLVGGKCASCGTETFPCHPVCPSCMSEDMASVEMPRQGILYAFTQVHVGPGKWNKPMIVGYVDLPNSVRVFAHLCGEKFRLGMKMALDLGEVGRGENGSILTSFIFRPKED